MIVPRYVTLPVLAPLPSLFVCYICGAVVAYQDEHNTWHNRIETIQTEPVNVRGLNGI